MKNIKKLLVLILFTAATFIYGSETGNKVVITGIYQKPQSYDVKNNIRWESDSNGEYLEIVVKGKILDFKVVSLTWDDDSNLIEGTAKFSKEEIENRTIILSTVLPEGIPSEKVKWTDTSGKEFEHLIQDHNGMGTQSHTFEIE